MAWNEVIESSNDWNIINNLYVLEGYWDEGYVLNSQYTWDAQSESSNTWTDTDYGLNTWETQSESSNTWVVIG